MQKTSTFGAAGRLAFDPEGLEVVNVGPGCTRCDLPSEGGVRAWIVDIAAGHQWPHTDVHDELGESVFIVSGELVEGEDRYAAGTYVLYGPNSEHRPRTETGVRLFGFNVQKSEEAGQ